MKWRSFKRVPRESKEGGDEIETLSLEGRKRYRQDEDEMEVDDARKLKLGRTDESGSSSAVADILRAKPADRSSMHQ